MKFTEANENEKRINDAMEIISEYGSYDGSHHKQWCLDQIAKILLGKENYKKWADEDWDIGIAP